MNVGDALNARLEAIQAGQDILEANIGQLQNQTAQLIDGQAGQVLLQAEVAHLQAGQVQLNVGQAHLQDALQQLNIAVANIGVRFQ